jgi:hypothetical protein
MPWGLPLKSLLDLVNQASGQPRSCGRQASVPAGPTGRCDIQVPGPGDSELHMYLFCSQVSSLRGQGQLPLQD